MVHNKYNNWQKNRKVCFKKRFRAQWLSLFQRVGALTANALLFHCYWSLLPFYNRTMTCAHTSLKISSSSLRLRSSTCLLPLSSASCIRRSLSASSVKAWILRSSWRRISSLDNVLNTCSSSAPTTPAWCASCWKIWKDGENGYKGCLDLVHFCPCGQVRVFHLKSAFVSLFIQHHDVLFVCLL